MYCFKVLVIIVVIVRLANQRAAWLCIVLRCWLLLSLLFDEQIIEPLQAAFSRPTNHLLASLGVLKGKQLTYVFNTAPFLANVIRLIITASVAAHDWCILEVKVSLRLAEIGTF